MIKLKIDDKILEKIAVDNNIKNEKGKYSKDDVEDVINFQVEYVSKYINTFGTFKKLVIPWGMFIISLRKLMHRSQKIVTNKNDYIDIYNSVLAYRLNSILSKLKAYTHREYLDCMIDSSKEVPSGKKIFWENFMKNKPINKPKYVNKIVTIVNQEYLGKDALVLKDEGKYFKLKLLTDGKVINVSKQHTILKNDI